MVTVSGALVDCFGVFGGLLSCRLCGYSRAFKCFFLVQFGDFRHCFELLFLLFLLLFLCIWAAVLGYKTVQFTGAVCEF